MTTSVEIRNMGPKNVFVDFVHGAVGADNIVNPDTVLRPEQSEVFYVHNFKQLIVREQDEKEI